MNPKEIGQILREARQKKGLTPEKVYKATHIQPKTIDALEQGRADEILSRVYVNLFLRKYAFLLGLDAEGLARDYKSCYTAEEEQILDLGTVREKEKLLPSGGRQGVLKFALYAGLLILFVLPALFFGLKLRSFFNAGKIPSSETASREIDVKRSAAKEKKKIAELPPAKKIPQKKLQEEVLAIKEAQAIFPIPRGNPVILFLETSDDAWMKVKKDGKVVFEGTLKKNKSKGWSADKALDLWVGKAEVLNFTVNGKSIGKIGSGNIKNIRLSRDGLKIGNNWLLAADR